MQNPSVMQPIPSTLDDLAIALQPRAPLDLVRHSPVERLIPVAVCGSVVGGMLALSLLLATLPIAYVAVFAITLAVIASGAACAADRAPFSPDEIFDREMASTYRALLAANAELGTALANAPEQTCAASTIFARSIETEKSLV